MQLAWDAPLQANGTPVPNLAGYKLYYGSQSGQYPTMVPVGMTTTYTVTNLSAGQTYYFAVKAYNSTGTESAFSNEVRVTLPTNTPGGGIIPQQQMRVVSVDSQELVGENGAATNAIDGNTATFWHTEWSQRTAPLPHTLVLDLGGQYQVDGFRYLPRQDGDSNGTIAGYQFYVSADGTTWGTAVAAGTLAANTSEKTVRFTAKTGRYVRLVALSEINGKPWTSAAELNIFGTIGTPVQREFKRRTGLYSARPDATLTWSATNATACAAPWTTFTAPAGSQSCETHCHHHLYAELHGSGRHSRREHRRHGECQTQREFKRRTGLYPGRPGRDLNVVRHQCDGLCRPLDDGHGSCGLRRAVKPTATTTYTLNCTGAGGTAAASTVVTVNAKPSVNLSAAPVSIAAGQTATLTWSATNATACAAPWTTFTAPAGSQSCETHCHHHLYDELHGAGGTAAASTVVTVNAKPSVNLSAAPVSIAGRARPRP